MRDESQPNDDMFPLAKTDSERKSEFSKRKKYYKEESFPLGSDEQKEKEGWTLVRENKSSLRMRLPKTADEILENRFWNVLYRFGYKELNVGRNFQINVSNKNNKLHKQIDVFAKDDETVIVAECKSSDTIKQRYLQKDINDFSHLQKSIANTIRKYFPDGKELKIIWFFVTDKIRWTSNDLTRAEESNIKIITNRELMYFEEISKKIGFAAKYQFHAEYLAKQKVPALANRTLPAVKTKVGGEVAYFFSARPIDILRISFVNHRDLRDPSGAPSYQRLVSPTRLREIGRFLDQGGYFPNTILLNFHRKPNFNRSTKDEKSNVQFGELVLPDRYKSCWVIDGQHRLFGTAFAKEMNSDSPLFFIAFEGMKTSDEANTFVTINEKQTKVPKKLLTELDGELKWDSDNPKEKLGAIASRCVDLLNTRGSSPFENKIETPGVSSGGEQPLTLPNFQQAINQSRLIGYVGVRTKELIPGPCWETNSENSLHRLTEFLCWYFEKLSQMSPERWDNGKQGYLCSNFGVYGHVRLLGELIRHAEREQSFDANQLELDELSATVEHYLEPVWNFVKTTGDDVFSQRFKVPFGSGGQTRYFFKLVELVRDNHPTFEPDGFEDFIQTVSSESIQTADNQVKWLQKSIPTFIIDTLKMEFGQKFFEKSVPKDIQKDCQNKRIDANPEDQLPVEAYLDWLQLRKIVEQKNLRQLFSDTLSIQMPEEKNGRHLYVGWFDKINEIRRISAHPAGREYKDEDISFLDFVVFEVQNKLPPKYIEEKNAAIS